MSKVTKLSKAVEIVKAAETKNAALDKMVDEFGITRSNAFVYYTKAIKLIDGVVTKPKGEKADKVVVSSPKREKKLSDIDRFIAEVKAASLTGTAPSPFQQLGA